MRIISHHSPNHNARPDGATIDTIVLHADAGRSEDGTLDWLASKESKVSYHYLIGRDGTVYAIVEERRRAWHAGQSRFRGKPNCNDYSVGVSFANDQRGEPFTPAQIDAGVALVLDIMGRHPAVTPERITTHAEVSPGRKHDPGPLFPLAAFLTRVREGWRSPVEAPDGALL